MLKAKKKDKIQKYNQEHSLNYFKSNESKIKSTNNISNGILISIELENWMNIKGPTKYYFNNGINIITGLNGSGKSSIICGIAISLGYDTHILSRGHYLSSYIRNGYNSCKLIIQISNNNEYQNNFISIIERNIEIIDKNHKKNSNNHFDVKSNWKLNGKKCIEKDIILLRNKLNIQLDNMMTFLAQQRVSYFATQTPQEIFIETLRTISNNLNIQMNNDLFNSNEIFDFKNNDLLQIYNHFIEISKNSKECRLKIQDIETKLVQLNNEISKSKQNELKYIQYLHHKMAINLINFFQILNEIKIYKYKLIELDHSKKQIIKNENKIKKQLQFSLNQNDHLNNQFISLNSEQNYLIEKITTNKLDYNFKNSINKINNIINQLQDQIKDPEILIISHKNKIKNLKIKIEDTKSEIIKYKNILKEEWIDKLIECKLYIKENTKLFDIELAQNQRKLLGNEISELSTKLSLLNRNNQEYELLISQLNDKKKINKNKNLLNIREKARREFYLKNVNNSALSNTRKENIIKFFNFINEYEQKTNFKNLIPNKKVLGPIGSYIFIKNSKIQSLVEIFLQQFHYYFVAEKEDVKLLTEKYKLNVLTLSNLRTPIYPEIDEELLNIGISGFLHEYLIIEEEIIKNILYQISPQFFTCAIIDNYEKFNNKNEDEILYKLSNWFKNKYDKLGNKISNNVNLFVNDNIMHVNNGINNLNINNNNNENFNNENNNGILYKLSTSIYNPNSKTISMIKLFKKMNTILINNDNFENIIIKEEFNDEFKDSIEKEINNFNFKIEENKKDYINTKNKYDEKKKLFNIILECITNIPPIQNKIINLENNLQELKLELESDIPIQEEINLNNKELIRSAIIKNDNSIKYRFESSIKNELNYLNNLFKEIATIDFSKNLELEKNISDLNIKINQLNNEIKKKKDELKDFQIKINELNIDYNKIIEDLDNKKKIMIDSYLQFYSTFYHYNKRFKNSNIDCNEIYEYIYKKKIDNDNIVYNDNYNKDCWKDVPGINYFNYLLDFDLSNNENNKNISLPSYCIDIIYQICIEFSLISKININFKDILDFTINNKFSKKNDDNLTLFDILLDNQEYKKKYDELYNLILKLESRTHNTNLERVSELEQEYELLKKENKYLKEKLNEYENFFNENHKSWFNKIKFIENYISDCFGLFMKFINNRHSGKIIIPFVDTYSTFESTNNKNKADLFDFFVNNFEKDSKLNIMVRFNLDENLRLFSSNSISGGEQSLCTILYILSLQVSN